ncbi:MAG TPA: precorrin-2 C(20)-methyltransferase, partial [Oscillatoriales cyanobacterium M4454_W2019_049]|nr:precorrin-2 C(20)-methyltransferase [Oscillatoriales cyanobacterium M4454_W2019_049]
MTTSPGRLYGLGIGPGDPELLTLKAHRILTSVPVIAYPISERGKSIVRAIVAEFIPDHCIELPLQFPFSIDRSSQPDYDLAAEQISQQLISGKDVAVLCEGEPMLYGTFMYLFDRLSGKFTIEIVPGISSITASAAMLGVPMTYRNDILTIIPATLDEETLRDRLTITDAAVIIKLGRHFTKVRTILTELDLLNRAHYIERSTQPQQKIIPISKVDPAAVPYWSLIVISNKNRVVS